MSRKVKESLAKILQRGWYYDKGILKKIPDPGVQVTKVSKYPWSGQGEVSLEHHMRMTAPPTPDLTGPRSFYKLPSGVLKKPRTIAKRALQKDTEVVRRLKSMKAVDREKLFNYQESPKLPPTTEKFFMPRTQHTGTYTRKPFGRKGPKPPIYGADTPGRETRGLRFDRPPIVAPKPKVTDTQMNNLTSRVLGKEGFPNTAMPQVDEVLQREPQIERRFVRFERPIIENGETVGHQTHDIPYDQAKAEFESKWLEEGFTPTKIPDTTVLKNTPQGPVYEKRTYVGITPEEKLQKAAERRKELRAAVEKYREYMKQQEAHRATQVIRKQNQPKVAQLEHEALGREAREKGITTAEVKETKRLGGELHDNLGKANEMWVRGVRQGQRGTSTETRMWEKLATNARGRKTPGMGQMQVTERWFQRKAVEWLQDPERIKKQNPRVAELLEKAYERTYGGKK